MFRQSFFFSRFQPIKKRGFSLLELMVSMAVLSLLMILLFQIFGMAMQTWQTAERKTDAFREARAALHVISRDLRNVLVNSNLVTLVLDDLYNASQGSKGNNQQIYALTAIRNSGKSDICAVGFYCYWDSRAGGYMLRRYFKNSDDTYKLLPNASPQNLFTPSGVEGQTDDTLAAYIWDFKVTAYDKTGTAMDYPQTFQGNLPAWIQIDFKALNATSAIKLKSMRVGQQDWFDTESKVYQNLIRPAEQRFSTRVNFLENTK